MLSAELTCRDCGWRTVCGEAEIARRLRKLGAFRRAPRPPEELVREVLASRSDELRCDQCRSANLAVTLDAASDDDGEWDQVVVCEVCRKPIPRERLEVVPGARRCAACQSAADVGALAAESEYCPKCGSLMELRVSRSGVTRYKMVCTGNPPCRL